MIDSIFIAIQQPFFLRSLIIVCLLAIVFPLYGNIVVVRQEANIAHTFAHLALLGVAIWLWFNRPVSLCILWSIILTVVYLYTASKSWATHILAHNEIWAQVWLVWAILIVSQMSGYKADISSYLFGDILLVWTTDVYTIAIISTLCLVVYIFFHKQRYALSLHHSLAISKWIPVRFQSLLYLAGLWVLIWWAMKIIGVLLVSAFLILPSNIAKSISNNTLQWKITWISTALLSSIIALFMSWHLDMPSWASIVWCLAVAYWVVSMTKYIRRYR